MSALGNMLSVMGETVFSWTFEVARPPQNTDKYAGVLYINNKPSFIYEITDTKKKDTWRKI